MVFLAAVFTFFLFCFPGSGSSQSTDPEPELCGYSTCSAEYPVCDTAERKCTGFCGHDDLSGLDVYCPEPLYGYGGCRTGPGWAKCATMYKDYCCGADGICDTDGSYYDNAHHVTSGNRGFPVWYFSDGSERCCMVGTTPHVCYMGWQCVPDEGCGTYCGYDSGLGKTKYCTHNTQCRYGAYDGEGRDWVRCIPQGKEICCADEGGCSLNLDDVTFDPETQACCLAGANGDESHICDKDTQECTDSGCVDKASAEVPPVMESVTIYPKPDGLTDIKVTFPTQKAYVEMFVRRGNLQIMAKNVKSSEESLETGYMYTLSVGGWTVGNLIRARVYAHNNNGPPVFLPGPTDSSFATTYYNPNVCQPNPCGTGACSAWGPNGLYYCTCPEGYGGLHCEKTTTASHCVAKCNEAFVDDPSKVILHPFADWETARMNRTFCYEGCVQATELAAANGWDMTTVQSCSAAAYSVKYCRGQAYCKCRADWCNNLRIPAAVGCAFALGELKCDTCGAENKVCVGKFTGSVTDVLDQLPDVGSIWNAYTAANCIDQQQMCAYDDLSSAYVSCDVFDEACWYGNICMPTFEGECADNVERWGRCVPKNKKICCGGDDMWCPDGPIDYDPETQSCCTTEAYSTSGDGAEGSFVKPSSAVCSKTYPPTEKCNVDTELHTATCNVVEYRDVDCEPEEGSSSPICPENYLCCGGSCYKNDDIYGCHVESCDEQTFICAFNLCQLQHEENCAKCYAGQDGCL